jgi:hypothetical protein
MSWRPLNLLLLRAPVLALLVLALSMTSGCLWIGTQHPQVAVGPLPNPLEVPVTDHEFIWNQISDTVDDYFTIAREERVRVIGNVMTEGRIETHPNTGATVMDLFRKDRTKGFETWHGTFQSIRRQAEIHVLPSQNGYGINVIVHKELEDVDRPEMSLVDASDLRHDGSLARPQGARLGGSTTLGWIPLGRDVALEQKILADLYARLNHVVDPLPVQVMDPSH